MVGRIEDRDLLDGAEVSSCTVGEDSRALVVVANASIGAERNSRRGREEEGMLAASSTGCDTAQGGGRTDLEGEYDRTTGVTSSVAENDNTDLEDHTWTDEPCDSCPFGNSEAPDAGSTRRLEGPSARGKASGRRLCGPRSQVQRSRSRHLGPKLEFRQAVALPGLPDQPRSPSFRVSG